MGLSHHGYVVLCYTLGVFLLVAFFAYALVCSYLKRRSNSTLEEFITARHRVSAWRIGWAFYAAAVGAWVITTPPSYSPYAGIIGCVFYALATGAPLVMVAYIGGRIQKVIPHVLSLTDFAHWRYGLVGQVWIMLIVCFNMAIALLAEYTTIGALFGDFVGSKAFIMMIVVGVLTMAYTAYGGLLVSIITDQVQGIASVTLILILSLYLAIKFREPLPHPMPCDPNDPMGFCISGTNTTGWSSLFSMPASLAVATVFSEAFWQRVWASDSKRSLRRGAWFGMVCVTLAVFVTGLCGWLAAWAGKIDENTNPNLYLFAALNDSIGDDGHINSWIAVVVLMCAVIMNESAIDSMQNGLMAAISTAFLQGQKLLYTRLAVICVNVPVMVVATKGYSVLELFLLANLTCSTAAFPLLVGLVPFLVPYYGSTSLIFSQLLSITAISIYGTNYYWDDSKSHSQNISDGMHYAWMGNAYDWRVFMVSICCSIGGVLLSSGFNYLVLRFIRKGKQFALPGFTAPASHPELFEKAGVEAEAEAGGWGAKDVDSEGSAGDADVAKVAPSTGSVAAAPLPGATDALGPDAAAVTIHEAARFDEPDELARAIHTAGVRGT